MSSPPQFVRSGDGHLSDLAGQQIAIIGYGHLGRPAALNLRSAGLDVVVGSDREAANAQAAADGFDVSPIADAIATADVMWLTVPDEIVPDVPSPTAPARPKSGSLVCFPSGYPLAFELTKLPDDVDQVMLAPRMLGIDIRQIVESGGGFFSYLSVEHDATGTARRRLLALAEAFGTLRRGALELSAHDEAALDLFVEQTVGPYIGALILNAFEVGAAAGLPAEALTLELYQSGEMARTFQAFADHGFFAGVRLHGHAASFGGFIRSGDIDGEAMKARFRTILEEIRRGDFARQFQEELAAGSPMRQLIDAMVNGDDPMTRAEAAVRDGTEG